MPFKVKEILLIANYYDSYTIEREGQFSGKIFGEYLQLNLFTAPVLLPWQNEKSPFTGEKRHFRPDHHYGGSRQGNPAYYQPQYKALYPDICQLMLVNNNADLSYLSRTKKRSAKP